MPNPRNDFQRERSENYEVDSWSADFFSHIAAAQSRFRKLLNAPATNKIK